MSCSVRSMANMPVGRQLPAGALLPGLRVRTALGDHDGAKTDYARAASLPSDYCFPFRFEELDVLGAALAANPATAVRVLSGESAV